MSAELKTPPQHDAQGNGEEFSENQWQQQLKAFEEQPLLADERLYWMLTIRRWLNNQSKQLLQQDSVKPLANIAPLYHLLHDMCPLLYHICDWPVLIYVNQTIEQIDAEQNLPNSPQCWRYLATAFCQMSQWECALHCIDEELVRSPNNIQAKTDLVELQKLLANKRDEKPCTASETLSLSPLDSYHINAFAWCYSDPKIASRCNLPTFNDDEQWHQWLKVNHTIPNNYLYAINHLEWGFVGCVSLHIIDDIGQLYYWVSQDFQGIGIATEAVKLMLDMASDHLGLKACYAKVYTANKASRKVLSKVGFNLTSLSFTLPNDDESIYYIGQPIAKQQHFEQYDEILKITQSEQTLLTPITTTNVTEHSAIDCSRQ
jgi:RimJ/RimL family protein N-acetyltransferase